MKNFQGHIVDKEGVLTDEAIEHVRVILKSQSHGQAEKAFMEQIFNYRNPNTNGTFFHELFRDFNTLPSDRNIEILQHSRELMFFGLHQLANIPNENGGLALSKFLINTDDDRSKYYKALIDTLEHFIIMGFDFDQAASTKDKDISFTGHILHRDTSSFSQTEEKLQQIIFNTLSLAFKFQMNDKQLREVEKNIIQTICTLNKHVWKKDNIPSDPTKTSMQDIIKAATLHNIMLLHNVAEQLCSKASNTPESRLSNYLVDIYKQLDLLPRSDQALKSKSVIDSNGNTALHIACIYGNIAVAQKMAFDLKQQNPKFLEVQNKDGLTPLALAALHGNARELQHLVEIGASLNILYEDERTPLIKCIISASTSRNSKYFDTIKILLNANGVDINAQDKYGMTPLMYAVMSGNKQVVAMLLAKGPDIKIKDKLGRTALHFAMLNPHENFKELFNTSKTAHQQETHISSRAERVENQNEIFKILARRVYSVKSAGEAFDIDTSTLYTSEVIEDAFDTQHQSPKYHNPLTAAVINGQEERINTLLELGSNPGIYAQPDNALGYLQPLSLTPTIHAIGRNMGHAVSLLIAKETSLAHASRNTSLHCIASYRERDYSHMISTFKEHGFDIDIKNHAGKTPLMLASYFTRENLVKEFLKHGANPLTTDNKGFTPFLNLSETLSMRRKIENSGPSYHTVARRLVQAEEKQVDEKGFLKSSSSLHIAAKEGKLDTVKFLLANGANPNLKNQDGKTPLDLVKEEKDLVCAEDIIATLENAKSNYFNYSTFLAFTEAMNWLWIQIKAAFTSVFCSAAPPPSYPEFETSQNALKTLEITIQTSRIESAEVSL